MGLLNDLGVSASDLPPISDIEKKMASGDLPPEGVHHAVVTAVGPIPNTDNRGWKFNFEIIAGVAKGATVEEVLWKPKGENEKSDATTRNRILLFGHRLGLLKKVKDASGKEATAEVEGKHDFCDCLGATAFIEVVHEKEKYEKNGKEKEITKVKLTFNGLLSPDDKKVKGVVTAGAGTAAEAAKIAATKAAAKPKDNFEQL
jgi:Fe2+ or Zn2+ uptake regulation protein